MCRAMEWCGRTPSSFTKSPAECSCIWAEYKCGQSKNGGSDSAQTEAFNRGLQPDMQSVLLEQNDLVTVGKEDLKIIHKANQGQALRQLGIGENPRESQLWDSDFMMSNLWSLDISDDEAWADDDYLSRCWGDRVKRLKLRVNMRSAEQTLHIEGMAGVQYHNQQEQEWDPWKTRLGEWVMTGQAEEEHPARFAWQMAVAICCGTAQKLQFRLGALHIPALQPLGKDNRSWWQTLPSNTISGFTMVPAGLHLPWCHQPSSFATYYHIAPSILVESRDLGETLIDEKRRWSRTSA